MEDMADMNFIDVFSDEGDGPENPDSLEELLELNKADGVVSTLNKCESRNASGLYIYDIAYKLKYNDQYDIGGTYKNEAPELWFFYTTTTFPRANYLLNLFVHHRNPGRFSIGVSNSNNLEIKGSAGSKEKKDSNAKLISLPDDKKLFKFNSAQKDTVHFVKTFCFSDKDISALESKILFIPIYVNMKCKTLLDTSVLQKIKAKHEFGEELLKDVDRNFVLKSSSGKEYTVHKIVLLAHSPVLREAIRAEDCNSYTLNLDDDQVELLIEYLYTGVIKNIHNQKYEVLLDICSKLKLDNLTEVVKNAIGVFINTSNALSLAIVAEKYNYASIQEAVFQYIQQHPEALESEEFSEIDNASIVKKLLKYIHSSNKRKNV